MQSVNVKGHQLEVRLIAGPGTLAPIVFLHEGLGCVSMWTQRGSDWPLAVCQASGRAGVVYSRRGYGQSSPAPAGRNVLQREYLHREAFDVLPALLAELHIKRPVLLGHSDGASIALLYASQFVVTACIAMAPHVMVESKALEAIYQARCVFEKGGLRHQLARHHADVDGAFWQWNDVWLSAEFAHFDIRPECSRIVAPLLLIQGVDDEYGTMRQLDDISALVVHAQQIRLADCGHSPHRDQSNQSLQAIVELLKGIGL